MIVDGLKADGKDPKTAKVVYMRRRPDGRQRHAVPRRRGQRDDGRRHQAGARDAGHVGPARSRSVLRAGLHHAERQGRRRLGRPTTPTPAAASRCSTRTARRSRSAARTPRPPACRTSCWASSTAPSTSRSSSRRSATVDLGQQLCKGEKPTADKKAAGRDAVHRRDADRRDHGEHAAGVRRRQRQGRRRVHRRVAKAACEQGRHPASARELASVGGDGRGAPRARHLTRAGSEDGRTHSHEQLVIELRDIRKSFGPVECSRAWTWRSTRAR